MSQNESCPDGRLSVLCGSLFFYKHVKGDVYGFRVKGVEITEVAEKAEITEVAEMAEMTEGVRGIRTTARHVVRPLAEMAEASIKTARHVM
jgi:hypothetical protein